MKDLVQDKDLIHHYLGASIKTREELEEIYESKA
jgi:hypothetical protein